MLANTYVHVNLYIHGEVKAYSFICMQANNQTVVFEPQFFTRLKNAGYSGVARWYSQVQTKSWQV